MAKPSRWLDGWIDLSGQHIERRGARARPFGTFWDDPPDGWARLVWITLTLISPPVADIRRHLGAMPTAAPAAAIATPVSRTALHRCPIALGVASGWTGHVPVSILVPPAVNDPDHQMRAALPRPPVCGAGR